ncbi:c6 zinc finger domain protein [Diplodia corticola]|uniref:C6 zinc finger domain protein n=1 Tax=Diplodia corticola TaxID=236234 RepID=A0A1J9R8Z7_9PEZI|nr:c6 zinc finger domain protein [Diplodia corticola]OJD38030.1 c6 zinc finger domain protein [Diplodia corticola]
MDVAAAVNQRRSQQACDACRRRKVRCNGQARCQQCSHLNLKCIYTSPNRGSSRKHAQGRGAVIQSYRKSTSKSHSPNTPLEVAPAPTPAPTSALSPTSATTLAISRPSATGHPDPSFFLDLLPEYLSDVYPVSPVVTEADVHACVRRMHTDPEAISFLYIFAAVTINLARVDFLQCMPGIREQIATLVQRCFDHRPRLNMMLKPTPLQVMTSIFIEICLMGLQKTDLALLHLREAQSLVKMVHVDDADAMSAFSASDRAKWQRAYWECFIHERFSALTDWEPVLLDPLPGPPEHDAHMSATIQQGWNCIIQTFLLIDRQFVDFWRGDRSRIPSAWLNAKHRQLDDERWPRRADLALLPAMQQADILITRQWLRTMLWQMAISSMLLTIDVPAPTTEPPSSAGPPPTAAAAAAAAAIDDDEEDEGGSTHLSLTMPLRLSSELRLCITHLSPQAVGIHGSGILHKLFEITNSILDVVINLPQAPTEDTLQRVDDILFLKKFLFSFPRIDPKHKRILNQKFERIRELYPGMEEIQMLVASPLSTVTSWGE